MTDGSHDSTGVSKNAVTTKLFEDSDKTLVEKEEGCALQNGSMSWRYESLKDLNLNPAFRIISLNLFQGPSRVLNLGLYYQLCVESSHLHVTTSCFTAWKKSKRVNGSGKIIPVCHRHNRRPGEVGVCVFFFDDNIEWGGTEDSQGICNLRDVDTGDFVNFSEGMNGFQREYVGRHTMLHYSPDYRAVLIKANILDALEDTDYFVEIISKFAEPDEKILVFMDVNSTIVCHDTNEGKDTSGSLLSSMFELIEAVPHAPMDFIWDSNPSVRLDKAISLKSLVKKITCDNKALYVDFFKIETCQRLLEELQPLAETKWVSQAGVIDSNSFMQYYSQYLKTLGTELGLGGIVRSWFRVFDFLQKSNNHSVILNSFGVDTRKVVVATVPDEREVMQITINYELWAKSDVETFEEHYRCASPCVKQNGASNNSLYSFFFPDCCSVRVSS